MKYTVTDAINDLINYLNTRGFILSEQAKEIFIQAESISCDLNVDVYYRSYLAALIKMNKPLQALLMEKGLAPDELFEICLSGLKGRFNEEYDTYFPPYSSLDRNGPRECIVDFSIEAAQRSRRNEIRELDILEALLNAQDDMPPPTEDADSDSKLYVSYNTLSHIHGEYNEKLWIKLDDIRSELGLIQKMPVAVAPSRIKASVLSFLNDNPDYHKNCFLIMPFASTPLHKEIHSHLKEIMIRDGLNLLRADVTAQA